MVIDSPATHLAVRDQAAKCSAVSVLERVIARATADGASDVHFEPCQDNLRIRCRIDGTFRDLARFDLALAPAVVARIKVLSNMEVAEHRLPQDGRFSVTISDQSARRAHVHLSDRAREKAVLRLLDQQRSSLAPPGDRIGLFGGRALDNLRELIHRPRASFSSPVLLEAARHPR